MSEPPPSPPPLLALDTRPIPLDELTSDLRLGVRRLLDILNAVRDDNRRRASRQRCDEQPWATVDAGRTYRIVMIDGSRGTGKTSLLLTLLQNWHPAQPSNDSQQPRLFTEDDVKVRALPPLDFDPHPAGLHAFAAIALAFERVAEYVDKQRPAARNGKTLRDRWAEIHKSALIGWTDGAVEHLLRSDLDAFVVDEQDGHLAWHRLGERWTVFIDDLLKHLVDCGQIPPDGVLVFPIDDLDLHPAMAGQLLLAIRLLRHDRLVFLLNGDISHLKDVLAIELFQKGAGDASIPEATRADRFGQAEHLSRALIDKLIPQAHRIKLKRLTLPEVATVILSASSKVDTAAISQWEQAPLSTLLNLSPSFAQPVPDRWRLPSPGQLVGGGRWNGGGLTAPPNCIGASLHLLFSRCDLNEPATFTFRDATALRALHASAGVSGPRAALADQIVTRARDSYGNSWFSEDCRLKYRIGPMKLVPWFPRTDQREVLEGHAGSKIEIPCAFRLSLIMEGGNLNEGFGIETLLSIWSFAHGRPHPDVDHPRTMWSPLALTRWDDPAIGLSSPLWWPGLMPWPRIAQISVALAPLTEGRWTSLSHWLHVNAVLAGLEVSTDSTRDSLESLLGHIRRATESRFTRALIPYRNEFEEWFFDYLPVLAAPEFGLPPADQQAVLDFFHAPDTLRAIDGKERNPEERHDTWRRVRDESLYLALNLHSQRGAVVDGTVSEFDKQTGRITELKHRIRGGLGASPWDEVNISSSVEGDLTF